MSHRIAQVQKQIRRVLSELLAKEGEDYGIGMVSINDILLSRDLGGAKVWVSFIAEPDQKTTFAKLIRHSKSIQTHLYKNLPIKKVPIITWILDENPALSYRIDEILDDINPTNRKNPELPPDSYQGGKDSDSLSS
ncbi:30S ribosome-binding factor RbfA [Patescibacteria group bacterium]|nr:30S ribosome-binding factor RbfA [Patescibacteria group bacterium]